MECCHKGKEFKVMDGDVQVATFACTGDGFTLKFTEEAKKMHMKHAEECCKKE